MACACCVVRVAFCTRYVREEDVEVEGDYDGALSDTSERPSGVQQNRDFEDSLR